MFPGDTIEEVFHKQGHIAAIEKLLIINDAYGKPGCQMTYRDKFDWYIRLNNYNKALDCLEKVFEVTRGIPYIATHDFRYEELKVYPRYIEMLKKMNLPLPEE